jgi:enoyl-CoA hydratase/carnithine racemase
VADRVATITLDRPDRLNAFTNQMMYELVDAFDRADRRRRGAGGGRDRGGARVLRRCRPG